MDTTSHDGTDDNFKETYFVLSENNLIQFHVSFLISTSLLKSMLLNLLHKLYQSESDDQERGVLNVKNCRLKKVEFKDVVGNRMYGFILMAKGKTFEFYGISADETNKWIMALK